MEEPAVQRERTEGRQEGGGDGGKGGSWKGERSLSSLLKHSCLLCWSSPRDADDTDERVLAKTAEIRELENAVAVENLELQEQQSDRRELEETLEKLEIQKDKLSQQIKTTRQLCYEESQQILSLQAQEAQRESQVEEYERELSRARWRLRRLREEVKLAKRKVEEAGERNSPLQDSIRQSYEEILQEENTLCSLSGGAVTPESHLEGSTSPADTTEEEPLPVRPWGRSQSLPAYADLIMGANGSSFCCNLADTREEVDDSSSSSPKMDGSNLEDDPEEGDAEEEEVEEAKGKKLQPAAHSDPLSQLDFYRADPFALCQSDHDVFNEDLFPKTDLSDGFASDPFKGSDPFGADVMFPETKGSGKDGLGNAGEEADTSLSCAENKASTGTQCFESEFPDEDSDIEISYSHEDLDTAATADSRLGFKPIQSSSEELGPEPIRGWRSTGQYSTESDPNGYELDLGTVSPPSDIEEHSLGSLAREFVTTTTEEPEKASLLPEPGAQAGPEPYPTGRTEQTQSMDVSPSQGQECGNNMEEEPGNLTTPQNSVDSQNLLAQVEDEQIDLSFKLNYESMGQASFDPYGFKLSPEHSGHTLLDPDEAELSLESSDQELTFDPKPSSSHPDQASFDHYDFDLTSSQMVRDSDPYGFKLSPEQENQEVLDLCSHNKQSAVEFSNFDDKEQVEPFNCSNQEVLGPPVPENQEVLEHYSSNNNQVLLDLFDNGNQEVVEPSCLVSGEEKLELPDLCTHENQEVVEPYGLSDSKQLEFHVGENQEVLELPSHGNVELSDFSCPENQEVPDLDNLGNQELIFFSTDKNQEVLATGNNGNKEQLDLGRNESRELSDLGSNGNQEVLAKFIKEVCPEKNNNQRVLESEVSVSSTNNSSDSSVASEDLLGLELSNASTLSATTTNANNAETIFTAFSKLPANQGLTTSNTPAAHRFIEGDLGSAFRAGGYIGCPDVADDLEPLGPQQVTRAAEPVQLVRPVRPPRPSLRAKEKAQNQARVQAQDQDQDQDQTQEIDLK